MRGAEAMQRLAALAAELRDHLLRIELEPGDDLAAIAPGSAAARRLGLEQDGLHAASSKMQRSGQAAKAAPDDDGLGGDVLPQLGEAWSRRGRCSFHKPKGLGLAASAKLISFKGDLAKPSAFGSPHLR